MEWIMKNPVPRYFPLRLYTSARAPSSQGWASRSSVWYIHGWPALTLASAFSVTVYRGNVLVCGICSSWWKVRSGREKRSTLFFSLLLPVLYLFIMIWQYQYSMFSQKGKHIARENWTRSPLSKFVRILLAFLSVDWYTGPRTWAACSVKKYESFSIDWGNKGVELYGKDEHPGWKIQFFIIWRQGGMGFQRMHRGPHPFVSL